MDSQIAVMTSKRDIQTQEDVQRMVAAFYTRVYADDLLYPIFVDVAEVSLEDHLPKMNLFWGAVLFGETGYRGNPMDVHRKLDAKEPLEERHFQRWLSIFSSTVDDLFTGPCAEKAKTAAQRINTNIAYNLARLRAKTNKDAHLL
jgi:hemoglobin